MTVSTKESPRPGHVQLFLPTPTSAKTPVYLEIPNSIIDSLCLRPRKYLRYLGWSILGRQGTLKTEDDGDIEMDKPLHGIDRYFYVLPEVDECETSFFFNLESNNGNNLDCFANAVDLEVIKQRSQRTATETRATFKDDLLERDQFCIFTGTSSLLCQGCHIIPHARGSEVQFLNFVIYPLLI